MKTVHRLLVGLVSVLALAGCATTGSQRMYAGAPRLAAEVARLVVPVEVNLLWFEGAEQALPSTTLGGRGDTVLEILPGRQRMSVRYYMPNNFSEFGTRDELPDRTPPVDLVFDAEAGKSYRIAFDVRREGIRLWVEDEASGQPVVAATPVAGSAEPTVPPVEATIPSAAPVSPATGSGSQALRILQDAWQLASPEDRASFRHWLEAQP